MRKILISFLVFLLLPFAALAQSDDRDTLTAFLEDNLSGSGRKVTVTGFTGAFSSQAQIDSLTIADSEGVWLTLNKVVLDWSRASLLRGVVNVTELTADEVIVARKPVADPDAIPSPEATGFTLPELPVSVSIKKLEAKRLVLGPTVLGEDVEATLSASLELDGGEGSTVLSLVRTGDGPSGALTLKASYANANKQLDIDLNMTEAAGGLASTLLALPDSPSIVLNVQGTGPLDDFAANLNLQTDGQERLLGEVVLKGQTDGAQKFTVSLNGDVAPLFVPEYAEFFGPEVNIKAEGQCSTAGQLDLTALSVDARALQLDGAAVIAADGLPQMLTLVGRLGLPSGEPVLLPFGGTDETRVAAADLRLNFDANKGEGWSAAVNMTEMVRSDVTVGTAQIIGSGRINRRSGIGGTIVGGTLNIAAENVILADAGLAQALGQDINGKLIFDWQKGGLGFHIGRLELIEDGYKIATSARLGTFESGFRSRGIVDAEYDDLSRLSILAGRPLGGKGAFRISGQIVPLGGEFDATAAVKGTDISVGIDEVDSLLQGDSTVDFAIARSKKGTFLRSLNIKAQQLVATAKGTLATDGSDVKGNLTFADLGALGAKYGGSLNAAASFTGTVADGRITLDGTAIDLRVGQQQADALIAGVSELSVAIGIRDKRLELEKADIRNPQLNAQATGYLDAAGSDVTANLSLPDLSPLGAGYGGALQAVVTAKGTVENGRITLKGQGNGLAVGVAQADGLLQGASILDTAVNIRDGRVEIDTASLSNPQISANLDGYYDPAGSDISANLSLPSLSPIGGGYRGALQAVVTAKGTLDAGRIELSGQGDNLAIGNAEADSLLRGQSTVKAAVNFRDRKLEIETATLSNPQLSASATGSVTEAVRTVQLEARLANLALIISDFPGAVTVSGTAIENGEGVTLDLTGTGPGGIDARIAGRIAPSFNSADLAITGSAQAALANAFLGARTISGQTQFDLRLNGPFALSSLSGRGSLSGGRFSAPNLAFSLQDIASTVTLGGNALQLSLTSAPSTGGTLAVDGSIGLALPNTADLRITLRNAVLKDPNLYSVSLGGDVTIQGPLTGGAVIGGTIRISEAELQVPTTGFSSIGSLPGLKHMNEPAAVKETRYKAGLIDLGQSDGAESAARPFGLNLTIDAPRSIYLRGRGIDAEFGGNVVIRGTTNSPAPSGAFELIRGRLDILGKRLDLTEAQMLLQGDLIPSLNIIATNEGDDVTTSVVISGRADDPEITFTSSPDLPQEEVLAQLLFGRDLSSISALQAAQLASAVASLAGKGGDGIVGNLRKSFGLDDLDLTTDSEGNVSLKAGKYLTEKVYTEVEVDQQGQSQINLNLDLKKNVTVRGSVSAEGETGIGIFVQKDY
ncbi:translocation/assembly module TamB domain-containing protein [Pseudorhodobacter sp. W20_MBD10_FR17]|uniref:translocation/assembly module TamB domain-containing protein n=1 Tax=Pseudorhodobacter sp. W20_MBD10_FR17 TaxID=3240266 RepID=UPI003F97A96B